MKQAKTSVCGAITLSSEVAGEEYPIHFVKWSGQSFVQHNKILFKITSAPKPYWLGGLEYHTSGVVLLDEEAVENYRDFLRQKIAGLCYKGEREWARGLLQSELPLKTLID